ncbi:ABC transporter permease [Thioclava nitratireducens]|uniref:ABC transporter permease n=1 Tax=Thioclava nitratireducens TaxID=1915078 RepID=A0ABN4XJG0_9RHOB|nr:amino acid ABC transporter permease [Thioclava nitratireducens]AQS49433.1 ABC transporter permease [Thioclava nitratireducens]
MYHFNFTPVLENLDLLLYGAWLTIRLSFAAMLLGLIVSVLGAAARTSHSKVLHAIVGAYVEIIRNTPFLVQIFFLYFGLPAIGISLDPNVAALIALVINVGAYGTEITRAGIESVPHGQIEAGRALGLGPIQIFRYVILKPALRNVYPAMTSQFIYLMLTSSVVSTISANDLASVGADLNAKTFASFEIYLVVTAFYLVLSLLFSGLFKLVQNAIFNYPASR